MLALGFWEFVVLAGGVVMILSIPTALILFVLTMRKQARQNEGERREPFETAHNDSPRTNA